MINGPRCTECGSSRKGDEFTDGTGYECPDCMSNVFYPRVTTEADTSEWVTVCACGHDDDDHSYSHVQASSWCADCATWCD